MRTTIDILLLIVLLIVGYYPVWYGYCVTIGNKDNGMYLEFYMLPLRRFFHRKDWEQSLFNAWMAKLKDIAVADMPQHYTKQDKWADEYFKTTYYDKGMTPEQAWEDYTTMIQ